MRTHIFVTALIAAALAAGTATADNGPRYIGPVTGNAERNTYASVAVIAASAALCFAPPVRQFGAATGDAEKDTYGYGATLIAGTKCPAGGGLAKTE
jgi:hypothetical protein